MPRWLLTGQQQQGWEFTPVTLYSSHPVWKCAIHQSFTFAFFLPLTGFALAALLSYRNLNISFNDSFEELQRRYNDSENRIFQLFSRVVSVVVSNPSTGNLSHPVDITLRHLQVREYTNTSLRDNSKLKQNNLEVWSCAFRELLLSTGHEENFQGDVYLCLLERKRHLVPWRLRSRILEHHTHSV